MCIRKSTGVFDRVCKKDNKQLRVKRRIHLWMVSIGLLVFVLSIGLCVSKAKKREEFVVVVDAGHGGFDPGKVGKHDVLEKDINLSIALKLKQVLEERDIRVIMTRDSDKSLATEGARNKKTSDLVNRVEIINSEKVDLLISIHQNSFTDSSASGAQVFYHGMSDSGKEFGELLQEILVADVDRNNRRLAKAGNDYYILRKSTCPGVIVECGFLSNPRELELLCEEIYQTKLADAIGKAVCEYFHIK